MKFKKFDDFVDHAQKRPRTRFVVVGKGSSWRIYEGIDVKDATAEKGESLIKASCQKKPSALSLLVVGGTTEIRILKEKIFAAQLKKDKNSLLFKSMKSEDHEKLEKMLMDLEGPLLEQVGQLKAVAREAAVPLLNQAKELASEGELGAATAKVEELKSRLATKDDSADQSAERQKLVLELEGELVDKVGQLKSPLRETVVPLLNEALKLARTGDLNLAKGKVAQLKQALASGAAPPAKPPKPTAASKPTPPPSPVAPPQSTAQPQAATASKPVVPPKPAALKAKTAAQPAAAQPTAAQPAAAQPASKPVPQSLDPDQEQLKHLGNYHGALSQSEAEALLKSAVGPAWLAGYSAADGQIVVSAKDKSGKMTHSLTIDPTTQKSKTVGELIKFYEAGYTPLTATVKARGDVQTPKTAAPLEQDPVARERLKADYEKNLAPIDGFFQALKKGPKKIDPQDAGRAVMLEKEKNKAVELANAGKYSDAIKILKDVQALIENARKHSQWMGEFSLKPVPGDVPQLDDCRLGQHLASGNYGAVYKLETHGTSPLVFKKPLKPSSAKMALESYRNEAEMYEKIGPHPNIARCLGMCKLNGEEGLALESINGGTVGSGMEALQQKADAGVISQQDLVGVRQFTLQKTLQTLAYIHAQGVIHADIKPENLMFDANTGDLKLVDFGIARAGTPAPKPKVEDAGAEPKFTQWGGSDKDGTDAFASPEQHGESNAGHSPAADIFSVGASAFWMGEGDTSKHYQVNAFYEQENVTADEPAVLALKPKKPTTGEKGNAKKDAGTYNESYQTEYVKFVNQLMNPNLTKRPSPAQALEHPFMKGRIIDDRRAIELIKGIKAPPAPAPPDPAADFKKMLAEWQPLFKTVLQANAPNAPEIKKLLAQAISLSKPNQGDMKLAMAKLTECHQMATTR